MNSNTNITHNSATDARTVSPVPPPIGPGKVFSNRGLEAIRPRFVTGLLDRHETRHNAFLLENTSFDYVLNDQEVLPIDAFVGDLLLEQGCELVVTYCLSEGIQLHDGSGGHGEGAEQRERRLRTLCGLRPTRGEEIEGGEPHLNLEEVMRGLNRLVRQSGTKVGIILKHAERLFPDVTTPGIQAPEQLAVEEIVESWGLSTEVRLTSNLVVALTQNLGRVSGSVRKAFVVLTEPLPDGQRIRAFLDVLETVGAATGAFGQLEEGIHPAIFTNTAKGLPLRAIEDLFRRAGVKRTDVTLEMVRAEKESVITQLADGALVPLRPLPGGFEQLAGIDHLVTDLKEIGRLMKQNPDSTRIPKAILLLGPPGTGKTSVARALAWEAGGINVVSLGEIKSSYVGESERRMASALRLVEGMSPCVVFCDEVDTVFVGRGESTGDSGTSKALLGQFLSALGDEKLKGKVLFVLASNRGDLLDAALLRRCTRVYLVSTPGKSDREKILRAVARRDGRTLDPTVDLNIVATRTEGCSGADLEKVLARAAEIADREQGEDESPITAQHLLAAVADYKPNRDEMLHEFFDLSAIRTCPFQSGIPWHTPERGLDNPNTPAHVRRCLREDGSLDVSELNRRLTELANRVSQDRSARQIG